MIKLRIIIIPVIFLILFIAVVFIIQNPIRNTFEYNTDEGIDVMKSLLFLKGFSLHGQIWSDQPPLFTVMLAYWLKFFGLHVVYARLLVFLCSLALLWALYQTVKQAWGRRAAFFAVINLLFSSLFLHLSISVMFGTASLALATLSIYCMTVYRKTNLKRFVVLSAIFIALSMQTKLFTSFLIPLLVLEILYGRKSNENRFLPGLLLWLGTFLSVFLIIPFIFSSGGFKTIIQQLIYTHLNQSYWLKTDFSLLLKIMSTDYDILLFAFTGVIVIARQKKWQSSLPVLWLMLAFIILVNWRPIWYHYYFLFSIPLCWLSGIGLSGLFRLAVHTREQTAGNHIVRLLAAGLIILFICRLPVKYSRMYNTIHGATTVQEYDVVNLILKYKPVTRWVFTDRPIFAFYAGVPTPPELAVMSVKRKFRDDSGQRYLIDILVKYTPEQILLNQLDFYGPKVLSYIEKNYTVIYQGEVPIWIWSADLCDRCPMCTRTRSTKIRLYLRNDLKSEEK